MENFFENAASPLIIQLITTNIICCIFTSFSPYIRSSRMGREEIKIGIKQFINNCLLIGILLLQPFKIKTDLPTITEFFSELISSLIVFELLIYWWHILQHKIPFLYQFHNYHHQYHQLYSWIGNEFSLFDSIIQVPLTLFYPYLYCHYLTIVIYLLLINIYSILVHSGYKKLDFCNHQFHHKNVKCNFGPLGICDFIFGTLVLQTEFTNPSSWSSNHN